MSIATSTVELPLKLDEEGVLRVANTRVRLETVLTAFEEGATPEEIVQDYSSLGLADVYAVISYYLQNTATVKSTSNNGLSCERRCVSKTKPDFTNKVFAQGFLHVKPIQKAETLHNVAFSVRRRF